MQWLPLSQVEQHQQKRKRIDRLSMLKYLFLQWKDGVPLQPSTKPLSICYLRFIYFMSSHWLAFVIETADDRFRGIRMSR